MICDCPSDRSDHRTLPIRSPLYEAVHLLGALLLTAGLTACQSSGDGSAAENAPPVVEVTAVDYAFAAPVKRRHKKESGFFSRIASLYSEPEMASSVVAISQFITCHEYWVSSRPICCTRSRVS